MRARLASAMLVLALACGATAPEKGHSMRKPLPDASAIAALPPDGGPEFNRLIHEKSPYLLQHARNPVDWYPWGEEAFARARREDKPVFLSVGYSSCHWCHVMEHESFESDTIAAILNEHFISIKVDREERPDVDAIYMTATQLFTGSGGWPNSLFLLPDGSPFFAGTYFPPDDRWGRPGFGTLLKQLAETYHKRRDSVEKQAAEVAGAMKQSMESVPPARGRGLNRALVASAVVALEQAADTRYGGFGRSPKFPPHGALRLLLHEAARTGESRALTLAARTLEAMARGGIHDQIGGGFHRYSTDEVWLVPHFEKMLYDNAQLLRTYADGYLLTRSPEMRRAADGIVAWLRREMTSPDGAFYSALDADAEGEEGKTYVWTVSEIESVLGADEGRFYSALYQCRAPGNFVDPMIGHMDGKNIPHLAASLEAAADAAKAPREEFLARVARANAALLKSRSGRIQPGLDDKVLASWNGLAISSLAYAGRVLGDESLVRDAARAADFVLTRMRRDGRLLRTSRAGEAKLNAYLDDYAFLVEGCLELFDATREERWLSEARVLTETMLDHFQDEAGGGFFFTSDDHEVLLVRTKDLYDKAEPSGNGVAAQVLVRLHALTGEKKYLAAAERTLEACAGLMERAPQAAESLILALAMKLDGSRSTDGAEKPAAANAVVLDEHPLGITALPARVKVARGRSEPVTVRLAIAKGWHINSHRPRGEYLRPTILSVQKSVGVTLEDIVYPPEKMIRAGFSAEEISVYEGEVAITGPITIAKDAKPGVRTLRFELAYQLCDNEKCLAPASTAWTIEVEVE